MNPDRLRDEVIFFSTRAFVGGLVIGFVVGMGLLTAFLKLLGIL